MPRKMVVLVPSFLVAVMLFPLNAIAQQGASAAITSVNLATEGGGVTFYVGFRVSNHAGETGKVRITLREGVDTLVAERDFRPESSPAVFEGFAVHIPYQRLTAEGRFRREQVHATIEVLSMAGRVLALESGLFGVPRTRPRDL